MHTRDVFRSSLNALNEVMKCMEAFDIPEAAKKNDFYGNVTRNFLSVIYLVFLVRDHS